MGRLDKKSQLRTQIDLCRGRIAGYKTVCSQLSVELNIVPTMARLEFELFIKKLELYISDATAELKTLEKKLSKHAEKQRLKRAKKKKKLAAKKED